MLSLSYISFLSPLSFNAYHYIFLILCSFIHSEAWYTCTLSASLHKWTISCVTMHTSDTTSTSVCTCIPNVTAEWLALLLHIREILGSNLCPGTGYTDWGFHVFFSPSSQMPG
jgi:hypothetical protein